MSSANRINTNVSHAVAPERQDGELLHIGEKCSAVEQKCTVVDYLPNRCDHCKKRFCQEHRRPESHSCKNWDPSAADRRALECPLCSELIAIPPGEDPNIRIGRHVDESCVVMTGKAAKKSSTPSCGLARCKKPLWQPIACDKCQKQFCATHRYPKDHQCVSLTSPSPTPVATSQNQTNHLANISSQTSAKSAAALAAIKRSFAATNLGSSSSSPSSSTPASRVQMQAQVGPKIAESTSASSAASTGSSSKTRIPVSSKDRIEPPSASQSAEIPPAVTTDNPETVALAKTSELSIPLLTGRCAPILSFLDADGFVPPPLFARA